MTDPQPLPSRRLRWYLLGLLVLVLVGLLIGGSLWWYHNDSDLAEVQHHAQELGRPSTWQEMSLIPADAERLHRWQRLTVMVGNLKNYQSLPESKRHGGKEFKAWEPLPPELLAFHAGLDPAQVEELAALLDDLGDQPLVLHGEMTDATLIPEVATLRELVRFLHERTLIATGADVARWSRRMLAACRRFSGDSTILHLVRVSCIEVTLTAISQRLSDLKASDPGLAEEITAATRTLHADFLHSLDGEFLLVLDALSHIERSARFYEMRNNLFGRATLRVGRRTALISFLDDLHALRRLDAIAAVPWTATREADFAAAKSGGPSPTLIVQGFLIPALHAMACLDLRTDLHARLIAAELQGQPWPVDDFAPEHTPLRPIRLDGRVIAAYSVDSDGIDQRGTDGKKDRIFPLYAKPPRSGTPALRSSDSP